MRALAISLGASTALAAAVLWAPLPASVFGQPRAPVRPAILQPPAPSGVVQASRAAMLIQFAPSAEAAAAKPSPPVLVGVVGSGPHRIAYVMLAGETVRAGLWDKVGPWRVTAIGPHGATLSADGKRMALAFYGPHPQPPPPPPAAADPDDTGGPSAPATPAPPPPPAPRATAPAMHTPEPASAPRGPGGPRYWVGPADSAPPGYVVLKPGQIPPR